MNMESPANCSYKSKGTLSGQYTAGPTQSRSIRILCYNLRFMLQVAIKVMQRPWASGPEQILIEISNELL